MEFIRVEGENLVVSNLFNEEHAAEVIQTLSQPFTSLTFKNVGVKIMRLVIIEPSRFSTS